ncbi:MAG: hypothetical protein CSA26_04600 [Desulfobacterales bacterium]|nr:MAG: hypothetical protein CSA26_04600 [Desulfobacterales bacterium]
MQLPILGVLVCLLAACTPVQGSGTTKPTCLTVYRFPGGEKLAQVPTADQNLFFLSFIHSVSKTPVQDEYRVVNGMIVQVAEYFETHGAGLPSQLDEPGVKRWEQRQGKFIVFMERPISRLIVRTDARYRNRLHSGTDTINLDQWPDQALEITIEPCVLSTCGPFSN